MNRSLRNLIMWGLIAVAVAGCVRKESSVAATGSTTSSGQAAKTEATPAPLPTAPIQAPAAAAPITPSYEVAIASAVGDHERGLDECKSRSESERKECTAKVDATYVEAKAEAEKGRAE